MTEGCILVNVVFWMEIFVEEKKEVKNETEKRWVEYTEIGDTEDKEDKG